MKGGGRGGETSRSVWGGLPVKGHLARSSRHLVSTLYPRHLTSTLYPHPRWHIIVEDSANEHIYHNEVWGEGGGICYRYDIHTQGPHACTLVHSTLPETCEWQCGACIVISVCVCVGGGQSGGVCPQPGFWCVKRRGEPASRHQGGIWGQARSLHKRIMINTCIVTHSQTLFDCWVVTQQ